MAQLDVVIDTLPPNAFVYQYVVLDVPGSTTANNNFLTIFNPVANFKTLQLLSFNGSSYASASSGTPNSMSAYRITAVSGGTTVSNTLVTRYDTQNPVSTADVRTGNPTVTRFTGTPLLFLPPPFSTGTGTNGQLLLTPPTGTLPVAHQGEGITFSTAAGNANQVWNLQIIWAEY